MTETEIERLKVTVIGENADFIKKSNETATVAEINSKKMQKAYEDAAAKYNISVQKIKEADLRHNPALDALFGGGNAPDSGIIKGKYASAELQKKIDEAVNRHNAEEARFSREALGRERERVQVAKQLSQERANAAKAQAAYDKGALKDHLKTENISDPFDKGAKSGLNYSDVLKGLSVVYGAFKVAQLAATNSQEEFNYQLQEGAKLTSRLSEIENARFNEAKEMSSNLRGEERIAFDQKELDMLQKVAEGQRKAKEAAEERVRAARGPVLIGALVRQVNAGGKQTELEEEEAALKAISARLDETRSKVQNYQRSIEDMNVGGDIATNALLRFKNAMDEQTRAVGQGEKAIRLARLESNRLSEDQKKEAEAAFDAFQAKKEAYEGQRKFEDDLARAEEKKASAIQSTINQFRTPQEALADRQAELDEMFATGKLPVDVYNRALAEAQNKLGGVERAMTGVKQASSFDHALTGSSEAKSRIAHQIDVASGRDSPAEKALPLLKKIVDNTEKPPGETYQQIVAANIGGS